MKKLPPLVLPLLLLLSAVFLLSGKFHPRTRTVAKAEPPPVAAPEQAPKADLDPVVAAPEAAVAGFWSFAKPEEADAGGLDAARAAASRDQDLLPAGRRTKINTFPNLRQLNEGEKVEIALPDGRTFAGTVNWSRRDEGYENTHHVSIGFAGNRGGLVASHDGTNGRIHGRLLIEHDRSAWTLESGGNGTLWLVERLREDLVCELPEPAAAARSAPLPGDSGVTASGSIAPVLNSKADADAVLYIDFDGQPTQTYPDWPSSNPGGVAIAVPHSGFTADQMTFVWRRVAEDFIQFNLNVTTDPAEYTAAAVGSRMRILVGNTLPAGVNGAGLAYVRSFRSNASTGLSFFSTVPCWIAVSPSYGNPSFMTNEQFASLASNTTHEFGHTLGLWHDGNDGTQPSEAAGGNYYPGHGTSPFDWGSIMGSPYRNGSVAKGMIQWAKNEYPGANNGQDDLAILASSDNGFGYRNDESSARGNAVALSPTAASQIGGEGIVADSNDFDWWSFQVPRGGNVTVTVEPADTSVSLPNLDCGFHIENSAGTLVAGSFQTQDNLTAESSINLAAGTYHVVAYGTGNRQFADSTGYGDYGSTGRYLVTVKLPPDASAPLAAVLSPAPGSVLTSPNLQFNGTASDEDRISGLSIFLRRNNDAKWWNGSAWQVAQIGLARSHDSVSGTWACTAALPPVGGNSPDALGAGTYSFIVIAEDPALNSTEANAGVTVDSGAPVTQIAGPANGSVITTSTYPFTGTVADSGGIDRVILFIRRLADNLYWDGTTWIAEPLSANLSSVYDGSTGIWVCNDTLPVPGSSLGNGSYAFSAIGFDPLGNSHQTDSFVAVDFHQIYRWTLGSHTDQIANNNNYDWGNPANWWPYGIPGVADIAQINLDQTVRSAIPRTVYGMQMSTGALDFDNAAHGLTVTNKATWTGGVLFDSVHIDPTATFTISGNAVKQIGTGGVIHNSGTATWSGPGQILGVGSSTWNNKPGSSFTATGDGDLFANYFQGNVFNNEPGASFVKSGKGSAAIASSYVDDWTFNNGGTIRSDDGLLQFNTVLNLAGGSTIARAGALPALVLSSNYFVLTGTTTVSGITFECSGDWHGNVAEGTAGNGTITTVSGGIFEWTGGIAHNTVNLTGGSVFLISGSAQKQIGSAGIINNHGNATWTGAGDLRGNQNSTFHNAANATFTAATDANLINYYGGNKLVNAAGATFTKTSGTDVLACDWSVENRGMLRCSSGAFAMNGGGVSSGTFITDPGCELQFIAGQHDLLTTARLEGSGKSRVLGGTVQAVNHVDSSGRLEIVDGLLTSSPGGSFSAVGDILWTGGTIAGNFHALAGSNFMLEGTAPKWIGSGGVVHNAGAAIWTGPGTLTGIKSSTWLNKSGGSFTATGDGDVFANYYSGNVFTNEPGARFIKTAGAAGEVWTLVDDWTFNNQSEIDSRQGTIHFNTTLNLLPGSHLAGAGRVLLNGTTNLATVLTSTGNPQLAGTLTGTTPTAGFSGGNSFNWSDGSIHGSFTLQSGCLLELTSATTKVLGSGAVFSNHGRVASKAGVLQGFKNVTINNESGGVFEATGDGDLFANYYPGNVFNNKSGAVFLKRGTSGTPDSASLVDDWVFNNNGTIRCDSGLLRFHTALGLLPGGGIIRGGVLPARVLSSNHFDLTGTTTVSNITFESSGDWQGNVTTGSAGNGTLATTAGGLFEWTGGIAHNTVNIAPGSAFSIVGSGLKQLGEGAVLNNGGIATRSGSGELRGTRNSAFVNLPGGVFHVLTSAPFTSYYSGNRLTNSGALHITGTSPLHWGFTQTATGRLHVGIGGPASFDRLQVTGDAILAGRVAVSLVNGYAPVADTAFPVLTFGSRSGTVSTATGIGSLWSMQHNATNLTLIAKTYATAWSEWAGYYFENPDAPDAQLAGDPDRDGLPNLLEYALGRDPHANSGAATLARTLDHAGETYLSLSFTRPAGEAALADVSYSGERSEALASWSVAGVVQHSVVLVPGELRETVTLRSSQPIGVSDGEFLHLKVAVGN